MLCQFTCLIVVFFLIAVADLIYSQLFALVCYQPVFLSSFLVLSHSSRTFFGKTDFSFFSHVFCQVAKALPHIANSDSTD